MQKELAELTQKQELIIGKAKSNLKKPKKRAKIFRPHRHLLE